MKKIIIVEGSIDVIAMHRAGFDSTVACMGTALTNENVHELKKLCSNIVLCFDGDGAGQKATLRSIDIVKDAGFDVKIVAFPEKMDPDEILKNKGKEFLSDLIENALPVPEYLIAYEKNNFDLTKTDERGKFAKAVLDHLRRVCSPAEQDLYLQKVRDLTQIPIDILRRDIASMDRLNNGAKKEVKTTETNEQQISRENATVRAVKFVLSSLIHHKPYVNNKIDYKKLLPKFANVIDKADENLPISSYFDVFDVDNIPLLKDCIMFNFEEFGDQQKYFDECIWMLADEKLKEKQKNLTEEFNSCQDNVRRLEIAKSLSEIAKMIKEKRLEDFYA